MTCNLQWKPAFVLCLGSLSILSQMVGPLSPASAAHDAQEAAKQSLRRAIEDLTATFGDAYPRGEQFLRRLARLTTDDQFSALRREALIANPLVSRQPILFVVRPQYWGNHGPINTMFQNGELQENTFRGGGALRTIQFAPDGEVREKIKTLVELPRGIARDPEISFDGRRVLFAMRVGREDDYHIYEANVDGSHLRQLTFGENLADVEPLYLPDDRIVFNSTRDLKFCQCNRHPMGNLFVMQSDGANIIQIGGNPLWEGHPSLTYDGRILYSRWEYVDRQFGPSFGLWTVNPDGTNHALYYGNNAWSPGAILDAHVIPGTQRVVGIFGACHDLPWGAMAIVDRTHGLDGSDPVLRIWPASARRWLENQPNAEWHPTNIDLFAKTRPKYEDPRPLADPATGAGAGKYFLVARTVTEDIGKSMQMGIFLVDIFGNELLLHTEAPGCYDPTPLVPRERPPVIAPRRDLTSGEGHFYVHDVYRGTGMDQVPRGTIKYLRIVEAPPKRAWTRPGGGGIDADQAPVMNWNLTNNKRILGDVPVESDGSAYFSVPANRFVYFQALDENKMMVQSMRSGTMVQPGERVGCIGCHEDRATAAPIGPRIAWRRPPSHPESWYGPPREFNYLTEVQPVFDRHCIACHDYGQEAGESLNLAGDIGLLFNTSYLELHRRSAVRWYPDPPGKDKLLIKAVHDGPPAVLPPYAWGSHRSRIVDVMLGEHYDVELDAEPIARVVTWIDLNAPYYGAYTSVYPDHPFGRSPIDQQQLDRLAQLVGRHVNDLKHAAGLQISFSRPSLSPILRRFPDERAPEYREALDIIRAGKEQLARRAREDQLGPKARPSVAPDIERHHRQLTQSAMEARSRRAIVSGEKFYPFGHGHASSSE